MPHLPDRHHDHDPALIAAFAAGDATAVERATASELVAACTSCASLRDDLVAIAAAIHDLPAPRRTRDYRLTAEQAAALRPTGWRRVLGALAGPRFRLAGPLGTTMATLGVAGLLLTASSGASISAVVTSPEGAAGPDPYGGSAQITGNSAQPDATDSLIKPGESAEAASPTSAAASAPAASGAPPAVGGAGQQPSASPTDLRQSYVPMSTAVPEPAVSPVPKPLDRPETTSTASGSWQLLGLGSIVLFVLGAGLVIGRLLARRLSPA